MLKIDPLPAAETALAQRPASMSDQIEGLAQQLAAALKYPDRPPRGFPVPGQLRSINTVLQGGYHYFEEAGRAKLVISHAAEWLLDNFYVIEQACRQVDEAMPMDYYVRLPVAQLDGRIAPRIAFLANTLARYYQSRMDIDQVKDFIHSFQSVTALTIGEIWALPVMLRLAVLEALSRALSILAKIPFEETLDAQSPWPPEAAAQPAGPAQLQDSETVVINSIVSLRLLATQDWKEFFENTNLVEHSLRGDPAGIYAAMDFETRNQYRNVVEELAIGSEADEVTIAQTAIQLAKNGSCPREQHVGFYLVGRGRPILESQLGYQAPIPKRFQTWLYQHALPAYLGGIGGLTALLCTGAVAYAGAAGGGILQAIAVVLCAFLALIPASAVAVDLINWLTIRIIPPRVLPRLDLRNGIPKQFSTLVVIPTMLKDQADLQSLLYQLEELYLANADPNLHFALLTDFQDAPQRELPGENEIIAQAREGIKQLNSKHRHKDYRPFFLFHRQRLWNPSEGCWMGWERKRGKLVELNNLLRGVGKTSYVVQLGDLKLLPAIRYVITLDADTVLPREGARHLIGTLAHPLNHADIDPVTGAIHDGYTVLQPRVQVQLTTANRSIFTRVYSGDTVLDLYTPAVSDVYQDLFGEGNYVGKGIYDVDAFAGSLHERVPDNTLLSHDLFEGIHGRCGLVTKVVVFEDYPLHYLTLVHRMHRWIRGDWQLLPWLGRRIPHRANGNIPTDLSTLDRWKILDNLRRSLIGPSVLAFLICGWLLLPGSDVLWTVLALSPYALGIIVSLLAGLQPRQPGEVSRGTARPLRQAALRAFFEIAFLPHESLIIIDAIVTTLFRLAVTHKRLLQWVTSAHTLKVFGKELKIGVAWRAMVFEPLFAVLLCLVTWAWYPATLLLVLPLAAIWMLSPYLAAYISRPLLPKSESLTPAQEHTLHLLARSTWLYFEHFVGPDGHWLPPDHFQEEPRGLVAYRTSPTNIGLLLLSTLSAYDLGYIGPQEVILRIRNTLDGMENLERQRGHFLNWYDTRTLAPLLPRYISTVDSGNLAACLVTLCQSSADIAARPILCWQGLVDTLDVLVNTLEQMSSSATSELKKAILTLRDQAKALSTTQGFSHQLNMLLGENRQEIEDLLVELVESSAERLDPFALKQLSVWIERVRQNLFNIQRDVQTLCPWLLSISAAPELFQNPESDPQLAGAWADLVAAFSPVAALETIPAICTSGLEQLEVVAGLLPEDDAAANDWCIVFAGQLELAASSAQTLLGELAAIAEEADAYFQAMNFRFLFDPQRQVFHIGYNVESGRLDPNYYDLLASEARIASLLAISKNDVPLRHWLHMARPLTQIGDLRVLLSWSGTMFEYLMPTLLVKSYPNTLMEQSCRAAVEHQIAYGQQKNTPWGISESSYYHFDAAQTYQYRAFGVPGLGYQRGLGDDLVIAPYASVLALAYAPRAVVQNIERLQKLNASGAYGLYESVDFTAGRLAAGQEYAVVRTYMAHHQGMVLLALNNYLMNKPLIRRFHADPRIKSVELLLQEQVPLHAPIEHPHPQQVGVVHPVHPPVSLDAWRVSPAAAYPQLHSISNGSYGLLVTATGSGYSRWRNVDLTRWRSDTTLDNWGTWLYILDQDSGYLWSAASQPTATQPDSQEVHFFPHKVEFERRDKEISLRLSITIAANDDVEIRRVTIINHADRPRRLRLTSYGEVILTRQNDDQRHPAFNRLFIESEHIENGNLLLFRRRTRSEKEKPVYLAHCVICGHETFAPTGFETERGNFLGRGGTARWPAALQPQAAGLTGATGATLDPIFALQAELTVAPYETVQLAFLTIAADSRKDVLELAHRYRQWPLLRRAMEDAAREAEQELIRLELTSVHLERIEKLLSVLLYPSQALRADPAILIANTLGQPGLWTFSISGDYPILLLRLKGEGGLDLLKELLQAHTYWRRRGLLIDLVILNRRETSYEQDFDGRIFRLLAHMGCEAWINQRGGIFIVREDQMSEAEQILMATAARAALDEDAGSLEQQLAKLDRQPVRLPHFVAVQSQVPASDTRLELERPKDLLFDNGTGGFSPDGREYIIYLSQSQWTPAPWVNVIANPDFGFLVSEAGMGCTWAHNSGENRLTPWHNDPVCDPPAEAIYLRDEDTGEMWSPTPLPVRADQPYLIRHGAGYSIFEHASHGLEQRLRLFAVCDAPVKIIQLKLTNRTNRTRRINMTYYAEWVLGDNHENMAQYIVPEFDSQRFALLARNPYNPEYGNHVAFLAATREIHWVTTDRLEFLGSLGSYSRPAALDRVGLSASVLAGSDPCAAMQILLWLAPGETKEVAYLLGQGEDRAAAMELIQRFQAIPNLESAWDAVSSQWDGLLDTIQVQTPDQGLNILLNRWLLYETLACRVWGRTAFYQSSGAFGYRDQLQDVMALLHVRPELTRQHILRAAGRQFETGDVLHWWHPPAARGIRTRISDNLLWLPYVTAQYVQGTGDLSILNESVPFLDAPPLQDGEHERYGQYSAGTQAGTVYDHCCRALAKGITAGQHGLPLMGAGDWNDGMNRVGSGGTGESIWLGWFTVSTLNDFASVCDRIQAADQASAYRARAIVLAEALETHGWDGSWYRRAYYDDGSPLGSAENTECQIDSISQSWSVISGAASAEYAGQAMQALYEQLVRPEDGLIALLSPPFDRTIHDPGYIRGYPPGIRENGGQYTHAALWAIWAFAQLGDGDRAGELFHMISPISHSDAAEKVRTYRVEPYVVAADIYSVPPHNGRGGWTWYTGSASWMYRLGTEMILGLRRRGEVLHISPCIPGAWRTFTAQYRFGESVYHIRVENPHGAQHGVKQITLDGAPLAEKAVPLNPDGRTHQVEVIMG